MSDRKKVYVHCRDYSSFLQFQKAVENKDRDCEFITDDIFLRGRWPAPIVVTDDADQNTMHHPIMESIETHRKLWEKELIDIEEEEELGETKTEKGEDDFYGV